MSTLQSSWYCYVVKNSQGQFLSNDDLYTRSFSRALLFDTVEQASDNVVFDSECVVKVCITYKEVQE